MQLVVIHFKWFNRKVAKDTAIAKYLGERYKSYENINNNNKVSPHSFVGMCVCRWDFSGYSRISGFKFLSESKKNGVEMHSE